MQKLFRPIRRLFRRRKASPSPPDVTKLIGTMTRVFDILDRTPMRNKYWLCGGAVLGYAREGALLRWDPDLDFHFWREDREAFYQGLSALKASGFGNVDRWINNAGEPTEYSIECEGIKVEFFEAFRENGKMRWFCYYPPIQMEFLNEVPVHGTEAITFYGREWLKPDDHETYFTALYGDWRVPNPDYKYWTDSKAIVRRDLWRGKLEKSC